jgi:protein-S-isoprenylcysteine O-methyltransferase Ste14
MLQFAQPWSLIVFIIHLAGQLARMHYEEKALSEAFPEYAVYAARTKKLIPSVF